MVILLPIVYISLNEKQNITEQTVESNPHTIESNPQTENNQAAVIENTKSIAESILEEWNVNIWSDLQKLFK